MHKGERWIEVALNLLCHGEDLVSKYLGIQFVPLPQQDGKYSYTLSFGHHHVVTKSQWGSPRGRWEMPYGTFVPDQCRLSVLTLCVPQNHLHTPHTHPAAPKIPKENFHSFVWFLDTDMHSKPTAGGLSQRNEARRCLLASYLAALYLALMQHCWARLSKATGKGEMVFRVQPDLRIKNAPILLSVSLCLAAACFHPTRSRTRTFLTCTHTYTALFWVVALCSHCAPRLLGHTLGLLHATFPKQLSPAQAHVWEQADFCTGKAQAVVLVTRDRKHHEAASPLTFKQHRQVSSLHIPPQQLQKLSSATTIFCHLSLQPIPYKGLIEYCWMSCLWQGLQTRSGLMLDGRGSSFAEQASQKMPLQFLQMFWNAGRGQRN